MLNGDSHKDGDKEIIQVNSGCPVFWAPFTVGSGFPDETVKGGYLADSSTDLYVIRAVQGDFTMFGYYNPVTAIGYVEHWGVKEVTHMELLLFLIWMFPVCTKIGNFYYRQVCCILFGLPLRHSAVHSQQETLYINSLRPSDATWRQWSWTTLAQVMACCLTAPSHYLNQCWLITRGVLWHTSESSFAGIAQGIDSGYEFEKDILKNIFKSPRGQWVKEHTQLLAWITKLHVICLDMHIGNIYLLWLWRLIIMLQTNVLSVSIIVMV